MTVQGVIRLRVFSGPHLGAEIVLPAGETLIGSDDSCDIILTDKTLAPRHALVRIDAPQAQDAEPQVYILPVDSQVRMQNQPVDSSGTDWATSTACVLGSTTLAWASVSDTDPWQNLTQLLSEPASIPPQNETELSVEEINVDTPTSLPASNKIGESAPESALKQLVQRIFKIVFRTIVLVACLAALAVSYEFRPGATKLDKEQLIEILNNHGFFDMHVTQDGGVLTVQGTVKNDAQRLQILKLAQSLQSSVHLHVQVRADRSEAIAYAFAQRGFFPEVVENPNGNNTEFLVRGYMKDSMTENTTFASLKEDFHAATPLTLVRQIRHAQEIADTLHPLLKNNGLDFTQVSFLPGVVLLAGTYTPAQREQLESIMGSIQQQLEIPIIFEIVSTKAQHARIHQESALTETITIENKVERTEEAQLEPTGFEVTGVTIDPLRFITLSTGERIFEGGVLPSGHVVENISTQGLRLSKDGIRFTYTLRGGNE
ncbi:MAG: type III secretion system inner membrane ring subunit SctD [Desulfomicrobium sp.]|nr:type III secretion system inner membrane ring subunit SctD [Desulfomicrobium sp.]